MRAVVMHEPGNVTVEDMPMPTILEPTDAIIKLAATCICGSDLWPYRGAQPVHEQRMGHEYVGTVVEVGEAVTTVKPGDFVVGSFCISCGECAICRAGYPSRCATAAAQGDLYNATSTAQVVDVNLKLADQQLAVVGNKVALHLPGAVESTGTITAVGTPVEKTGSDNSSKERFIPLTVVPDDLSATSSFQEVSVTVGLPSEKRENVLSVPVSALIALTAEQFGVELVEDSGATRKVPVTTGMFAGGRVEISGEGLAEGQRVVVPQR